MNFLRILVFAQHRRVKQAALAFHFALQTLEESPSDSSSSGKVFR